MNILAENKIKDIEEFTKLFKINIPVKEEFEYYVETMEKSNEYKKSLDKTIEIYIDLENYVAENGFSSVRQYKNKKLDEMVDYLASSQSYKNLIEAKLSGIKIISRDHLNMVGNEQMLISLDFKSANYNVLKIFSPKDGSNELCSSWVDLCAKFDVHPALVQSKSFRQIIFGNTNPGRLQTFQRENMLNVREYITSVLNYKDEDFVFISHDEVVLKVKSSLDVKKLEANIPYLEKEANGMEIRTTVFSLSQLKKNTFVKTIYSVNSTTGFNVLFTTLHGAPGNKFYMYFKKHIIKEPIEDRDLMYYNDNELCTWIDEDDVKKKKNSLPHYEKPKVVISINEAISYYSYVWDNLSTVLPNMSSEEKRRAIEVFANTCTHCHQSEVGCQCWNDD